MVGLEAIRMPDLCQVQEGFMDRLWRSSSVQAQNTETGDAPAAATNLDGTIHNASQHKGNQLRIPLGEVPDQQEPVENEAGARHPGPEEVKSLTAALVMNLNACPATLGPCLHKDSKSAWRWPPWGGRRRL